MKYSWVVVLVEISTLCIVPLDVQSKIFSYMNQHLPKPGDSEPRFQEPERELEGIGDRQKQKWINKFYARRR